MKKTIIPILSAILLSTSLTMLANSPCAAKKGAAPAAAPTAVAAPSTVGTKADAPQKKDISLKVVNISSPIKAGSDATVSVQTEPNALCDITVKYKSGPATAAGLKSQRADKDGKASWTWKVAKNCAPGEWPVDLNASLKRAKATAKATLKVEK